MTNQEIIDAVAKQVRDQMENEGSGHDWWHVFRVWNLAKHIGEKENADMFTVELTALLHDVADWKFHDGDETAGPKTARKILSELGVDTKIIDHVADIILHMSFKGAGVESKITTLEGKVVQDSDRLDAIGAIGIGRTFAYGGSKNRPMYDPAIKPTMHTTKEAYFKSASPTINHFYEKLLLLKDLMNTKTAREMAESRHDYMEAFLDQFFKEWDGKL